MRAFACVALAPRLLRDPWTVDISRGAARRSTYIAYRKFSQYQVNCSSNVPVVDEPTSPS